MPVRCRCPRLNYRGTKPATTYASVIQQGVLVMMRKGIYHNRGLAELNADIVQQYISSGQPLADDDIEWITNNLSSVRSLETRQTDLIACIKLLIENNGFTIQSLNACLLKCIHKIKRTACNMQVFLQFAVNCYQTLPDLFHFKLTKSLIKEDCYPSLCTLPNTEQSFAYLLYWTIGTIYEAQAIEEVGCANPALFLTYVEGERLVEHLLWNCSTISSKQIIVCFEPTPERPADQRPLLLACAIKSLNIDVIKHYLDNNTIMFHNPQFVTTFNTFVDDYIFNTIEKYVAELDDLESEEIETESICCEDFLKATQNWNYFLAILNLVVVNTKLWISPQVIKKIDPLRSKLETYKEYDNSGICTIMITICTTLKAIEKVNGCYLSLEHQLETCIDANLVKQYQQDLSRIYTDILRYQMIQLTNNITELAELFAGDPDDYDQDDNLYQTILDAKAMQEKYESLCDAYHIALIENDVLPSLAQIRATLLQPFEHQKIITHKQYLFLDTLAVLITYAELHVTLRQTHRKYSGPSQIYWDNADSAQQYYCLQIDNECWVAYTLPLVDLTLQQASQASAKQLINLGLLSSLFYHTNRSSWANPACKELRALIQLTNQGMLPANATERDYKRYYEALEKITYYAECPSDDSDDEEIKAFEKQPIRTTHALLASAKTMIDYGQVNYIWTQDGKKFFEPQYPKKNKKIGAASSASLSTNDDPVAPSSKTYRILERAEIHREEKLPMTLYHDLSLLNNLYQANQLNASTIKQIETKFYIALYRGIHYDTANWNQSTRRQHRQRDERRYPLFSQATYAHAKVPITQAYDTLKKAQQQQLKCSAALISHQLHCLKYSGPVHTTSLAEEKEPKPFSNAYLMLQDLYTRKYDAHKARSLAVYQKKQQHTPITTVDDAMLLFAVGPENYNLSTGDTPYHPLRYALGLKSYGKGKSMRLRPRWRKTGRAERPYSGKVYTFLISPLSYQALDPRHLVSLTHQRALNIDYHILNERETTISGMIPEESLLDVFTAKYPSFVQPAHKAFYLHRYGMDEKMYQQFRKKILGSEPHTRERKRIKFILGEHLCAYHEACMIEDARLAARQRNGWLVYHDRIKGFSLVPPPVYPSTSGKRGAAGNAQRQYQKKCHEEETTPVIQPYWLAQLLTHYSIIPGTNLATLLSYIINKKVEEPMPTTTTIISHVVDEKLLPFFNKQVPLDKTSFPLKYFSTIIGWLRTLCQQHTIAFEIHSFLFKKPLPVECEETNPANNDIYVLLYAGGDGFYGLRQRTKRDRKRALPVDSKSDKSSDRSKGYQPKRHKQDKDEQSSGASRTITAENALRR